MLGFSVSDIFSWCVPAALDSRKQTPMSYSAGVLLRTMLKVFVGIQHQYIDIINLFKIQRCFFFLFLNVLCCQIYQCNFQLHHDLHKYFSNKFSETIHHNTPWILYRKFSKYSPSIFCFAWYVLAYSWPTKQSVLIFSF